MSIATKLTTIANIKEAIRQAIVGKGVACPTTEPFANYAAKIAAIPTGGTSEQATVVVSAPQSAWESDYQRYSGTYKFILGTGDARVFAQIANNTMYLMYYQPGFTRWVMFTEYDINGASSPLFAENVSSGADPWGQTWHVADTTATCTVTKVE